jgi:hypothetical protein
MSGAEANLQPVPQVDGTDGEREIDAFDLAERLLDHGIVGIGRAGLGNQRQCARSRSLYSEDSRQPFSR